MEILVNKRPAALKEGASFDYVSENRLFYGADDYSLTITFPLRGCPANLAIFGHINRHDTEPDALLMECEIIDRHFRKAGSLAIVEINDAEVKCQFLEGRSVQNYSAEFDSKIINTLPLGPTPSRSIDLVGPKDAWDPGRTGHEAVALPWLFGQDKTGQNAATYTSGNNAYRWADDCEALSWQPYLLFLTRKICDALGYAHDFAAWENDKALRHLLVCNAMPATGRQGWDAYAPALPAWTAKEFFERLEPVLGGYFDIDHYLRTITFRPIAAFASGNDVELTTVADEFTRTCEAESDGAKYAGQKVYRYKESGSETWKFCCCPWFYNENRYSAIGFDTLTDLMKYAREQSYHSFSWSNANHALHQPGLPDNINRAFYAKDVDCLFILHAYSVTHDEETKSRTAHCDLMPVNQFGPSKNDVGDSDEVEEIECVPAPAAFANSGRERLALPWITFASEETEAAEITGSTEFDFEQTATYAAIEAGEGASRAEYYDKIYLAWWDGEAPFQWPAVPHAHVCDFAVSPGEDRAVKIPDCPLRLNTKSAAERRAVAKICPDRMATFTFAADRVPDVRAPFLINNRRYVCAKITATFTDRGLDPLMKGEFYPLK